MEFIGFILNKAAIRLIVLRRPRNLTIAMKPSNLVHVALPFVMWLVLPALLSSCAPTSLVHDEDKEWVRHDVWSSETQITTWEDIEKLGLGVGFMRPGDSDIHPDQRSSTREFTIQSGQSFATFLILSVGGTLDKTQPLLVSIFLDYEQVSFSMDGQQGILHYLEVQPGGDLEIPIEVNIASPGWHDLFVVVFLGPEYHPVDPQSRFPMLNIGGRRTVICVDECTMLNNRLPEPLVGNEANAQRLHINALALLPGDAPPADRLLSSTYATPGDVVDLELWARNTTDRLERYIVLPLLNFRQTPFVDGEKLLDLHMPPKSELFVDGQLQLPQEGKVNEFQFITIFDPYADLSGIPDPFVQSEMRSAIITASQ